MTNKSLLENGHPSKAEQRKQRLLEAEAELALEEADALQITEEQRRILAKSFLFVKTEFSDLDGLRWTQNALRESQVAESGTFVVGLRNHDPPSLASDATIRITVKTSAQPRVQLPCRNRDGSRSRPSIVGLFATRPPTHQCRARGFRQIPESRVPRGDPQAGGGDRRETEEKPYRPAEHSGLVPFPHGNIRSS